LWEYTSVGGRTTHLLTLLYLCNLAGNTALHVAVINGHKDVVQYLLRHGGDAHALNNKKQKPVDVATKAEIKQLFTLIQEPLQVIHIYNSELTKYRR
jgi:ankyrin repeat protein